MPKTDDGLEHSGASGGPAGTKPDPKTVTPAGGGSNPPTPYQSGDSPHVPSGDTHPFTPPPVPGGDGTKGTSVDTPSLDRFAENIDKMIKPVMDAYDRLHRDVGVAPGAFYDANKMRVAVNGPNRDSGLKGNYENVLQNLITGLTDTRDGARKLSHDYGAAEDANKVTAKNLSDAFSKAPGDFSAMMTANGGSGAPSTGDTGSGTDPKPGSNPKSGSK
ncbi:hypothetical protein [Streptomyces sp. NPDC048489]|uniref:hypothetical protein n=1 Tax=Streptomyces sp. NPDC048489 TaxID=3154504 RepID=UPI00341EADE5